MKKRLLLLALVTASLGSCSKFGDWLFSDAETFSEGSKEDSRRGSFQANTDEVENSEGSGSKEEEVEERATVNFYVEGAIFIAYTQLGSMPNFPSDKPPYKEPTETIAYTFDRWEPELSFVTEMKDYNYTAIFKEEPRKYDITFDVEGNKTVLKFEYGEMPDFGGIPTYETAEHHYSFVRWEPAITKVTEETTYTAVFTTTKRKYKITFNVDGVETSDDFEYGTIPTFNGTPTKDSTDEFDYTFDGWDPTLTSVTNSTTYTAKFKATRRKYDIIFDVDGVETIKTFEYGEIPSFGDTNPTRAATAESTYTFKGWEPEIAPVTGIQRYVAQFNSSTSTYFITFKAGDKILQRSEWKYGTTPEYTGKDIYKGKYMYEKENGEWEYYKGIEYNKKKYIFAGWDKEISPVTDDTTYTAVLKENVIIFYCWRNISCATENTWWFMFYTDSLRKGNHFISYYNYPAGMYSEEGGIGEAAWVDGCCWIVDDSSMYMDLGKDIEYYDRYKPGDEYAV